MSIRRPHNVLIQQRDDLVRRVLPLCNGNYRATGGYLGLAPDTIKRIALGTPPAFDFDDPDEWEWRRLELEEELQSLREEAMVLRRLVDRIVELRSAPENILTKANKQYDAPLPYVWRKPR